MNLDFNLIWWRPLVELLMNGLRTIATPLEGVMTPGLAGGLAIILFTVLLRVVLLPLALFQIRSQRHQLAIQPELRALQRKYKGNREELARAQMQLYKERGVNPAAGCLPLLIQLPILFAMYSAMQQLATQGLTLDQVTASQIQPGQVTYAAGRSQEPLPFNQFVLARFTVDAKTSGPVSLDVVRDQSSVEHNGVELLQATQGITLTPGTTAGDNPNPPNTPNGAASIFLRAGLPINGSQSLDRSQPFESGQSYVVEIWVNAAQTNADQARAVVTYDPAQLDVSNLVTPPLQDLPFKSRFLWLPSLGEPDLIHVAGVGIPGLLLIIMTITSFLSQRMTTMPTDDPQQQAMMRSMAFMPLMYLFFFLGTPAGLVLYWLVSNLISMVQQYFTVGLGLLGGDIQRLTGRDLQPPWAHIPTSSPSRGAAGDGLDGPESPPPNGSTPALRGREPAATRRQRPGAGKGRRRGKR